MSRSKGFTVIELVVVVTIIAIMTAIDSAVGSRLDSRISVQLGGQVLIQRGPYGQDAGDRKQGGLHDNRKSDDNQRPFQRCLPRDDIYYKRGPWA